MSMKKLDYRILLKYKTHPILGNVFKELVKDPDMKQSVAFGWTQSDWAGNWTQSDWAGNSALTSLKKWSKNSHSSP
jgi:hypothetical protein